MVAKSVSKSKLKAKPKPKRTPKPKQKYLPGQIVITKSGKRYIVNQNMQYVPLTSKKNAQRRDVPQSKSQSRRSVSAPRAGSLQLVNGQTYVVGEDRKTYIPITQSAASGTGVLITLLEIAAVILIADLVVDLIIDDIELDDLSVNSFNNANVNTNMNMNTGFGNTDFGDWS